NLLPTKEKLHTRYPLLYPNDTCPRCLIQPETQNHIFTCTINQNALEKISAKIRKTLIKNLSKKLSTSIPLLNQINNFKLNNPLLIKNLACGIIGDLHFIDKSKRHLIFNKS